MAYNAKDIWRSKRLVYRGIIFPEDEALHMDIMNDPQIQAMSNGALLRPPSRAPLERFKTSVEECLLSCIICIPKDDPPPADTAESTNKTQSGGQSIDDWHARQKSRLMDIGRISLSPLPRMGEHHRFVMIGITILEEWQGKGYGTEAINWAVDWAFEHAGMHKVTIGAFSFNERAWKLYEKMGFVIEGRLREAIWYHGGWHDIVELGMLEHEWREMKRKQRQESSP